MPHWTPGIPSKTSTITAFLGIRLNRDAMLEAPQDSSACRQEKAGETGRHVGFKPTLKEIFTPNSEICMWLVFCPYNNAIKYIKCKTFSYFRSDKNSPFMGDVASGSYHYALEYGQVLEGLGVVPKTDGCRAACSCQVHEYHIFWFACTREDPWTHHNNKCDEHCDVIQC